MEKKCYAKINIGLNVMDKLDNGYHKIDTILARINLFDTLTIEKNNLKEDKLISNIKELEIADNIIIKTINLLRQTYKIENYYNINLVKNIPLDAGLGGGSSNAAQTIEIINELENLNLTLADKILLSQQIGSDIAFFLFNTPMARVRGTGEDITPFRINIKYNILLIKPQFGLSTASVYSNLELVKCAHPNIETLQYGLATKTLDIIKENFTNSLEEPAFKLMPELVEIKKKIQDDNNLFLMSGSGTTFFILFENKEELEKKLLSLTDENLIKITAEII